MVGVLARPGSYNMIDMQEVAEQPPVATNLCQICVQMSTSRGCGSRSRRPSGPSTHDDVPVGAVILGPDGELLGAGHNERELLQDPSAHAEMLAIRAGRRARSATGACSTPRST